MIIYAASFLTQISSLPSRAVRSFQDGSSAFHVEATVLQVDPQNAQVSRKPKASDSPNLCYGGAKVCSVLEFSELSLRFSYIDYEFHRTIYDPTRRVPTLAATNRLLHVWFTHLY